MKAHALNSKGLLSRAIAAVLAFFAISGQISTLTAIGIDNNLSVAITRTNQNVILQWFGSNAVAYQVESSPTLAVWSNASSVITGSNAFLFVTNSITSGQSDNFFRVKRIIPDDPWTASFNPLIGLLTIIGNDLDNTIVVSRDAAGNLQVNGGTVPITGGTPTVSNTFLIQIFGRGGSDQLSLNETNGPLPKAHILGEGGDDTLTGGSGTDTLIGGAGLDTLWGKGGADSLIGGDDNDTLTGGDDSDNIQLGNGNDRSVWHPGDDTDVVEGGDGIDTVEVNGGGAAEDFTVTTNGTHVRFDRINPAPFSLDISGCENLELFANGGNDTLACTGDLSTLIQITADGGAGEDTLRGSNGNDLLRGGDGDDFLYGQQGSDVIFMGADNDTFQWDPGDGNDTIEGETGNDILVFNGNSLNEIFNFSALGSHVNFTRNIGNVGLDVAGVETFDLNALGNTDSVIVNNLTGTDLTTVNVNLATTIGGVTGDAAADIIIVNGTQGDDLIDVFGAGTSASVLGLTTRVNVTTSDGTNDSIVINALGGEDSVTATTMSAGVIKLTIDGGADNDSLLGSQGDDLFLGGEGDDFLFGDNGNDLVYMGANDDVFQWDPGDGNDTLEGQDGTDKLVFFGSNAAENFDLTPNGSRLIFFRNIATVTLNCDDVEKIQLNTLGGTDSIVVGELTSTDLNGLLADLAGPTGGGDGSADSITVNGTQTNDNVFVTSEPGIFAVTGLSVSVTVTNAESVSDSLTINGLAGLDVVDASALATNVIKLTINGGLGVDTLTGSQGSDLFNGGDGNDQIFGGAGNDTFVWNPGDDNDTFEGQAGNDTLQFNGANIAENINLSAVGGRLHFTRNVATVTTDCNDVENVRFEALGGADNVTLNDLSTTDVTSVNINLANTVGGVIGDAQPDSIHVNGTSTNDVLIVNGSPGVVSLHGLSTTVTLTSSEAANDRVTIYTLGGDDTMDASGLAAGVIALTADGGDNHDTLIGSDGPDTLLGGNGDDVLVGGLGVDVLDGGAGNNTVIP